MQTAALPEARRKLLKSKLTESGKILRILEAHNGLSAMIVNDTRVTLEAGENKEFDGLWVSSLTESTSRGLPDVELQGMNSRINLVNEIVNVTDKFLVVDGDTGGTIDQLQFTIRALETYGVSALIIEDKIFPKNNSLDDSKDQILEQPAVFAGKIKAGKKAVKSQEFMLIARIESLIAGKSLSDALHRCKIYLEAGADGIVIHSRAHDPGEIFAFAEFYSRYGFKAPLIAIPTTYNSVTETELQYAGFRVIIYANHLLRSAYQSMVNAARIILKNSRAHELEAQLPPLRSLFEKMEAKRV